MDITFSLDTSATLSANYFLQSLNLFHRTHLQQHERLPYVRTSIDVYV